MGLSRSVSDRDVKEWFPCPQLSSPLQAWWYSWAVKISELVAQWNLPSFHWLYPGDPLTICRNEALPLQETPAAQASEQGWSAAALAELWLVGLQVVRHICKDTSYDASPCDSSFLLRSPQASLAEGKAYYNQDIGCNFFFFAFLRNNRNYGFWFIVKLFWIYLNNWNCGR